MQSNAIRCNQAHLQPRLETLHVAQRVEVALDASEGLRLASVLLEDLELFRGGQAPEHGRQLLGIERMRGRVEDGRSDLPY